MNKGKYITVEGLDGAGKSTLIRRWIKGPFTDPALVTIVPSFAGTPECIRAREVADGEHGAVSDDERLDAYAKAAISVSQRIVKPALDAGITVVRDRGIHSAFAYWVGGYRKKWEQVRESFLVPELLLGVPYPDLVINVEVGIGTSCSRQHNRPDHYTKSFVRRVWTAYRAMFDPDGRWANVPCWLPKIPVTTVSNDSGSVQAAEQAFNTAVYNCRFRQ